MAENICNVCGKSFECLSTLNRHLRTIHQIEIPNMRSSAKKLSCPEDIKRKKEEYQRKRYQNKKKEKCQQQKILEQKQHAEDLTNIFNIVEREERVQFELNLLSFRTQLINQGFASISGVLCSQECSELLAELGDSGFIKIFNTPSERNSKRMQKELNNKKFSKYTGKFVTALQKFQVPFQTTRWVGLQSLPGCAEQEPHLDYNLEKLITAVDPPHFCLLALQENTTIEVWPGSHAALRAHKLGFKMTSRIERVHLNIPRGTLLVITHLLLHAGSGYKNTNTRIHGFLENGEIDLGATYLLRAREREICHKFGIFT